MAGKQRGKAKAAAPQNHSGCKIRTSEGGPYEGMNNPRAQPGWLCHKGRSNPRGRGEPLPYKCVGLESVRGVGGSQEGSPVIRRALRLKVR